MWNGIKLRPFESRFCPVASGDGRKVLEHQAAVGVNVRYEIDGAHSLKLITLNLLMSPNRRILLNIIATYGAFAVCAGVRVVH